MSLTEQMKMMTAGILMLATEEAETKPGLQAEEAARLQRARMTHAERLRQHEEAAAPWRAERAARKAAAWEKRQPKKVGTKVAASHLKQIAFPECGKRCAALEHFGVCECESICGFKFHPCDEGCSRKSLTQDELNKQKGRV